MTAGNAFTLAVVVGTIACCMAIPRVVGQEFALALIAPTALGSVLILASFLYHARRHHQLATGMARLARPGSLGGQSVEFVTGLASPVVAGLLRPRIFCAEDLTDRLDRQEIEAVILHERHHLLERAPLRIVALSALAPLVGHLACGQAWLERERARIEIAADRYALAAGASRSAIAGALLKLSESPDLVGASGFASAIDFRIRALLEEPTGLDPNQPRTPTFAAVSLLLATCLVAYFS